MDGDSEPFSTVEVDFKWAARSASSGAAHADQSRVGTDADLLDLASAVAGTGSGLLALGLVAAGRFLRRLSRVDLVPDALLEAFG